MDDDLSKVFNIDRGRLDSEWAEQPNLFFIHSKRMDKLKDSYEKAKTNLELVTAEVDQRIRARPERYGLSKTTDNSIKLAIIRDEKYQEAVAKVNSCRHKYDVAASVVKALDHRKKALENLVDLHGQSYFSAPISRNREAGEDMIKKAVRQKSIINRRESRDSDE